MQFSFVTLFAVVLALAASVLPALSSPIATFQGFPDGTRPRIGITIRPNAGANAPIAMNLPPLAPSRRDDLNLDSVMWRRIIDLPCTQALNAGTPLPAECYDHPAKNSPFFTVSKIAARAFMAGLMH